jgi:hypothetical protein
VCVCACVCACVRACVCACVRVCIRPRGCNLQFVITGRAYIRKKIALEENERTNERLCASPQGPATCDGEAGARNSRYRACGFREPSDHDARHLFKYFLLLRFGKNAEKECFGKKRPESKNAHVLKALVSRKSKRWRAVRMGTMTTASMGGGATMKTTAAIALAAGAAGALGLYVYRTTVGASGGYHIGSGPAQGGAGKRKKAGDDVAPQGPLVNVFYGSQTGTAEEFAKLLAKEARSQDINAVAVDLDKFSGDMLPNAFAIFLVATYGEVCPHTIIIACGGLGAGLGNM